MTNTINIPEAYLTIREAHYTDANALSTIITRNVRQLHAGHYSKHQIRIWQNGYTPDAIKSQIGKRPVFVLECGKSICGTIQLDPQNPEIKGFYLNPKFTDKGLGNVLFGFIISYLKMSGCQKVELTSNKWTIPFYRKQQFQVIGKEIVYWQNEPFEEWRMVRTFGGSKNHSSIKSTTNGYQ